MALRTPSLGCILAALATAQQPAPTVDTPPWQRARAVFFVQSDNPVGAEACVGYEALAWDQASRLLVDGAKTGDRVGLGRAGCATFDTISEVDFAGTKIKPDDYFIALERSKDGWALLFLDARKVRGAQSDPVALAKAPVLARTPLQYKTSDGNGSLTCALQPDSKGNPMALTVNWGPHAWSCSARVRGADGTQPLAQPMLRRCSRVVFAPAKDGKLLAALLDHGTPAWNGERAKAMAALKTGSRWRFGTDWWTTLDSDVPLLIGGKKLPAGCWHLVLQKADGDGWNLCCCAAADQLGQRLDAFSADQAKPALVVPLTVAKATKMADALQVQFAVDGRQLLLEVLFGDHRLTVPLTQG
ncbi:MAG TPA: DUF2911 domain-containing protein [Planctomycetota bacterium]|nr:DUF2911 domain-containing protein [Planctomycetota bacterium]